MSYAQMTRKNNRGNVHTDEFPPLGSSQRKKTLNELVPYTKGKGTPNLSRRLAAPRPTWSDNKVLVVSRLDTYFINHKDELHDLLSSMAHDAAG